MTATAAKPLFELGRILITPGAIDALREADANFITLLQRHATGDWGDLCDEDKEQNEMCVTHGCRIFSAYKLPTGAKLWVITEADRCATTGLLPSEY